MFQQLIAAIEYINKLGINHRDIKSENILIDYDKTLKIVDFGLSELYTPGTRFRLRSYDGTPNYAAPEWFLDNKKSCLKSDIWGSGVVLYNMLTGELPFNSRV